jgi:hypothetical protein
MPVGRHGARLIGIRLERRLALGVLVEALTRQRMEAVAVGNGVGLRRLLVAAGQPGAHAVTVHQQHAVVGFQLPGVTPQRLAHQATQIVGSRVVIQLVGSIQQRGQAPGTIECAGLVAVVAHQLAR